MNQYDQKFDLKINVGHCDLYFTVSNFALYIEEYDLKFDTKQMLVTVTYISCSSDFALYLEEFMICKHYTYGLWVSMTWSWSDFILTFRSMFLLEVI